MKFNINHKVRVKLTVTGAMAYRRYVEDVSHRPAYREVLMNKIEDGWLTEQLYTIMEIFGQEQYMGNPSPPFEMNMEFLLDGPMGLLQSMVDSYDALIDMQASPVAISVIRGCFLNTPATAKKLLAGELKEPSYNELMEIADSYKSQMAELRKERDEAAQISHQMRNERDALQKEYERVHKIAFACPPKGDV